MILALWAVPRSVSTAFERMMMERGDFHVLHEPFSVAYYYSPMRRSARYDSVPIRDENCVPAVAARIAELSQRQPVFFKDMAYHLSGHFDLPLLGSCRHAFLIRHPGHVLPSLHKMMPDFSEEETGYERLHELFDRVRAASGQTPCVIDSEDLCAQPQAVIAAFCAAVGIPFLPQALHWTPGPRPEWQLWEPWHAEVASSQGFLAPRGPATPIPSGPLAAAYQHCLLHYEALRQHSLRPTLPPSA